MKLYSYILIAAVFMATFNMLVANPPYEDLQTIGKAKSCYFTIEQSSANPLSISNLPISNINADVHLNMLSQYFLREGKGYEIIPSRAFSNIYIIRSKFLEDKKDPLSQKIDSFRYKGAAFQLPYALSQRVPGITAPGISLDLGIQSRTINATEINVESTEKSVRDVLIAALPKTDANRVLFCVTYDKNGNADINIY